MIKIKQKIKTMTNKALCGSMNVKVMTTLAKEFFPNYNLNSRMGYPENIPVPNRDAARQIIDDIYENEFFPNFITLLIKIHYEGLMGKKYNIPFLREIIKEMYDCGLIYDQQMKMFIEDSSVQKTQNWGVLRSGEEYNFTFLRLDIVKNTQLVRNNKTKSIEEAYENLRLIVQDTIEKRNGRIWQWEGDGGLCSFLFGNCNTFATLCAIEILNKIFIYNHFNCKLTKPIEVRIAVHCGYAAYNHNMEKIKNEETIKKLIHIESKFTKSNSITISDNIHSTLDFQLTDFFEMIKADRKKYYNYSLKWEKK